MAGFRVVAGEHRDGPHRLGPRCRRRTSRSSSCSRRWPRCSCWGPASGMAAAGTLTAGTLFAFVLYLTTVFAPIQQLSQVFDTYQQGAVALRPAARPAGHAGVGDASPPAPPTPGRLRGELALRGRDVRLRRASPSRRSRRRTSTIAAGRDGGVRGRDRRRASRRWSSWRPASTTRPAGRVLVDGRAAGRRSISRPTATSWASCPRRRSCSPARSATTSPTAGRTRPTPRSRRRPGPWAPTTSSPALAQGYHQPVIERGRSLSSGQRQLIALARAELVDPAILILDEATANLDLATEARVLRAMSVVRRGPHDAAHRPPASSRRPAPTGSSCSTAAGSSRSAPTTSCSPPAVGTPPCGRRTPAARRPRRVEPYFFLFFVK